MRRFAICLWLLLGLLNPSFAVAEDVNIQATVSSSKVSLGSSLSLTISIKGTQEVNPLQITQLEGFEVNYIGPSRNISIVNGQYSSSISFQYQLLATKVGKFQIPSLSLTFDGKTYSTPAIPLEVVSDGSGGGTTQNPVTSSAMTLDEKIFLRLSAAKEEGYVNEPMPIKVLLYVHNMQVRDVQYPPDLEALGFHVGEFKKPTQYQKVVNGVPFTILEMEGIVYPTRTGEISLGPAAISANILVDRPNTKRQYRFFDDDFFDALIGAKKKHPLSLESDTVTMQIKEIPGKNRPESFTGGVGKISFEVTADPKDLKVGDPITLRMSLFGNGNLDAIQFPSIISDEDFKVYDPDIKKEAGKKILEQVIIPLHKDVKEISPIEFSFFDPESEKYRTIKSQSIPINVKELEGGDVITVIGLDEGKTIFQDEVLGNDLIFIKTGIKKLRRIERGVSQYGILALVLFLFFGGFVFGLIHFKRTHKLETDSVFAKRYLAPRQARANLSKCSYWLEKKEKEKFYDQVFKTLQDYVSHKLHISYGNISKDSVKSRLPEHLANNDIVDDVGLILSECEMVRYAAATLTMDNMKETYTRIKEVIDYLERRLK